MKKPPGETKAAAVGLAWAAGWDVASKTYGVHRTTLQRWVPVVLANARLHSIALERKAEAERDWKQAGTRFMQAAISKLEELVSEATVDQIREVAGAIKVVGELGVAKEFFQPDAQQPGHDRAPSTPEEPSGPSGAGGSSEEPAAPLH